MDGTFRSAIPKLLRPFAFTLFALPALHPTTTSALDFDLGSLQGTFDTTLSLGLQWRVQSPDPSLIDQHNGGSGNNLINNDEGNRNFERGLISTALKATHDLELAHDNLGAFLRGSYFYDFKLDDHDNLSEVAKQQVAKDAKLLDAYVYGDFTVGGKALQLRLGNQVVNWGESTFIPNGISIINPVDVAKLRVPGAEIREALLPSPMIWASQELTDDLSAEAFYIARSSTVEIDPQGTYFSDNDVISPGADSLVAGFGVPDENGNIPALGINDGRFLMPRGPTDYARNGGEYGLALRAYAPRLNHTEFGFYYINYHSRLPLVSFVSSPSGQPPSQASYFVEYPEDIRLYGLSFNTIHGPSGIALQGEVSYRPNVPMQIEFAEAAMAATHTQASGGPASQLGDPADNSVVTGYRRLKLGQAQLSATKAFGRDNPFGASSWNLITEIGATKVFNLPSQAELRFEAPGTNLPARDDIVVAGTPIEPQPGGWADAFSWGYRLVSILGYSNVIGAVNMSPRLAFAHDVQGNSPVPGGNFVEDRMSLTLGLGANYLEQWSADLSYTSFFGAGSYNTRSDRDFVALNLKYAF